MEPLPKYMHYFAFRPFILQYYMLKNKEYPKKQYLQKSEPLDMNAFMTGKENTCAQVSAFIRNIGPNP